MKSFISEIENPIVAKDILELEEKIHAFQNKTVDEEKFRSLRLARGVYGQRQQGVQMVRIKLPLGKFSAQQLLRICNVADTYSNGILHLTTRQDIQLHYVQLNHTPKLWAELEKDAITLREACGNTVRNVTASVFTGVNPNEAFDATPVALTFFDYFLRNPICQDLGRKFKVAFSCSPADYAMTFVHDLGFIPVLDKGRKGFRVVLGGGIGSQPMPAIKIYDFLPVEKIIPFSEAVLRVFERYGERNKRNKARLKFLIQQIGIDTFLAHVREEQKTLSTHSIALPDRILKKPKYEAFEKQPLGNDDFLRWKENNLYKQKQQGYYAVGIAIANGNITSDNARQLAEIIRLYTRDDNRLSQSQSILLRDVKEAHLLALYYALKKNNLHRTGFHKVNDIVACPGTDTCNLGIASSTGLAKALKKMIEVEFRPFIENNDISIKISGCMNACGQHTLAHIGFQGMTIKSGAQIAPATQVLMGGGVLGNGNGRFADKILKVPAKRVPLVLRWILKDFEKFHQKGESFLSYYERKTKEYFYHNLKKYSVLKTLEAEDFVDWGVQEKYRKAIGIGECAGVRVDLVQTLLFDAKESGRQAMACLNDGIIKDAVYHAYNASIRAAKAILTQFEVKLNTHTAIINAFDVAIPEFKTDKKGTFKEHILKIKDYNITTRFAQDFIKKSLSIITWIENHCHAKTI